jgi:hypothetical protein
VSRAQYFHVALHTLKIALELAVTHFCLRAALPLEDRGGCCCFSDLRFFLAVCSAFAQGEEFLTHIAISPYGVRQALCVSSSFHNTLASDLRTEQDGKLIHCHSSGEWTWFISWRYSSGLDIGHYGGFPVGERAPYVSDHYI